MSIKVEKTLEWIRNERDIFPKGNPGRFTMSSLIIVLEKLAEENPESEQKPIDNKELKEAIARGWCSPKNSKKQVDPGLIEAIADQIKKLLGG